MSETLTYVEASTILATMTALREVSARFGSLSYRSGGGHEQGDAGRMTTVADIASDLLFDVLNTAHSRCECPNAKAALDAHLGRVSEPVEAA